MVLEKYKRGISVCQKIKKETLLSMAWADPW